MQTKNSSEHFQTVLCHLWWGYLLGYMPASFPDGPMLFCPPGGAMPPSGPITWSGLQDTRRQHFYSKSKEEDEGERRRKRRRIRRVRGRRRRRKRRRTMHRIQTLQSCTNSALIWCLISLPPLVAGPVGVLGPGAHPCQGPRGRPAGVHVLHGTARHLTRTKGLTGPRTWRKIRNKQHNWIRWKFKRTATLSHRKLVWFSCLFH